MKFTKIYKIINDLRNDIWSATLLLSYSAVAAVITFIFFGKTPIQMYNLDIFIKSFLMPTSFIAGFYYLWVGYVRKDPLSAPVFRWITATSLALCFMLFWPSFTTLKIAIPKISPFYFDQYLIQIDRWLHFGIDPWRIVHFIGIFNEKTIFEFVYFQLWLCATTLVLLFIIYFDQDSERKVRYLFLYIITWVVLGNLLATIFSSAGPIYIERLTGDTTFRDLEPALVAMGYADSGYFVIQNRLWEHFITNKQEFGSGISAFPSVHVGVACVVSLYMSERSRWLIAPSWSFVILILAGSVFCGWHYAVDGYVSIMVVLALHRALRKLFEESSRSEAMPLRGYIDSPHDMSVG